MEPYITQNTQTKDHCLEMYLCVRKEERNHKEILEPKLRLIVPMLRMNGAIFPHPLYTFMVWTGANFTLHLYTGVPDLGNEINIVC